MAKNAKVKVVGKIVPDKKLENKIIWTDEAFKEYFGMSKQEIEQIVEQEHEDIKLELRKIEGIDGLFYSEGKLLLS